MKNGTLYHDLGPDHFDQRTQDKQVQRLINRLRNLGFAVQNHPCEDSRLIAVRSSNRRNRLSVGVIEESGKAKARFMQAN